MSSRADSPMPLRLVASRQNALFYSSLTDILIQRQLQAITLHVKSALLTARSIIDWSLL